MFSGPGSEGQWSGSGIPVGRQAAHGPDVIERRQAREQDVGRRLDVIFERGPALDVEVQQVNDRPL